MGSQRLQALQFVPLVKKLRPGYLPGQSIRQPRQLSLNPKSTRELFFCILFVEYFAVLESEKYRVDI